MINNKAELTTDGHLFPSQVRCLGYWAQIVSYPRSGSNYLNYLLEQVLGFNLQKSHRASAAIWEASIPVLGDLKKIDAPIICLLRNYKECIPRQTNEYAFGDKFKDALKNKKPEGIHPSQHRFDYILVLDDFHNAQQEKILVYYEDFMTNPKEEVKNVLLFLSKLGLVIDWNRFENVFDNLDYHAEQSIKKYISIGAESQTKGKDLYYHSKKMSVSHLLEADASIKNQYSEFYNKFLKKRYAEKKSTRIRFTLTKISNSIRWSA